jgi:hypothetical protein
LKTQRFAWLTNFYNYFYSWAFLEKTLMYIFLFCMLHILYFVYIYIYI